MNKEKSILIVTVLLLIFIIYAGLGAFRSGERDRQRIADAREIQQSLRIYYLKFQMYPLALSELPEAGIGLRAVPEDPLSPERQYLYATAEDRQQYVLLSELEDKANYQLNGDLDGQFYGLNCDDRPNANYCVSNL